MLVINKSDISFTKGDTVRLGMQIYRNNKKLPLANGDEVVFSIKRDFEDTDYILTKTFINNANIYLSNEETSKISVGDYVYDVQVKFANNSIYTICVGNLHVTNEVTANG